MSKERLVELIKDSLIRHVGESCLLAENIADDLLANGVIVPPVKVGSTIYRIIGTVKPQGIAEWDIVSLTVFVDEIGYVDDSDNWINFNDLGKTVFPTREEAEKKLKEMKGE